MKETPVERINIAETPVIRPKNFREDAFFNHPENRDFLMGHGGEVEIDNGITMYSSYTPLLIGVLAVALLIMVIGPAFDFPKGALVGGAVALVGVIGVFLAREHAVERKTTEVT